MTVTLEAALNRDVQFNLDSRTLVIVGPGDGAQLVAGPQGRPGPPGGQEVYAQSSPPAPGTTPLIWVDIDDIYGEA